MFTLTAEADRVLCQLVMFLTVFFYWMYEMKFSYYQKEGRGVSGVSFQVHIFYIGHSRYGQLTAVKTGYPLTSTLDRIAGSGVTHRGQVFFEVIR